MRLLNHISIKSKLIVMLLTVSGCSIVVTAYLGYRSGQANLTQRVYNQLTSVRASKAYQIESYVKTIHNHTETLSEDLSIGAAMEEFKAAYQKLETEKIPAHFKTKIDQYYRQQFLPRLAKSEGDSLIVESYTPKNPAAQYLQYHYIAANPNPVGKKQQLNVAPDGSDYSRVHQRYHNIFRNIIEKFGYYDMFLLDTQGNLVYTVFKETDFATNFLTGPYKDSNLAQLNQIVQDAKKRNYSQIVDFQNYEPSYGVPAAFIAAPIYKNSQLIGVLAFQLPVDEINNVMTGNQQWKADGLGESGETYLVGRDYLMRSVSRFLVQDPQGYESILRSLGTKEAIIERIKQFNSSILLQPVRTKAVEAALAGKTGTQIIPDYRNITVLSSYAPLQLEGLDWVILSEIDLAEAYAPIYSFAQQILIYATLLILVVTLIAMGLAYLFVLPINQLIHSARRVSAGELDAIAPLKSNDEFGELAKSFNAMVRSLRTQTNLVKEKSQENEQLLLSVFPSSIAKRLKKGERNIAEDVSNVAVIFSDLTGFSKLSESLTAYEIVSILNDLVAAFDEAAERYGIEKIKTIGDSYLGVCGLSIPYLDHDKRAVDFALEMLAIVRRFNHERNFTLNIRIGINSGDVVAGIVGRNKFIYDVWGDTINTASALRSACPPGMILVSQEVRRRLQDIYQFESIPEIDSNGKTPLNAWQLQTLSALSPTS
ncbi:MAG: adenylate/guanylate cyclase domain-containing protein [Snowella sp.]|nr:adenylate/guanylate cyclase domain-containing protein [Snowella sp.]